MRATIGIATCAPHSGLERLLASLEPQLRGRDDCEVLVVDNTPGTAAAPLGVPPWAQAIHCRAPGLHAVRHTVLRRGRGAVLIYIDDDCEAAAGWLDALLERFADPEVIVATGPVQPIFAVAPPAWLGQLWSDFAGGRFMTPLSLLQVDANLRWVPATLAFGLNFAIRRDALVECGGFHPDAMPRDRFLHRGDGETAVTEQLAARGVRAAFARGAVVLHHIPASRVTLAALTDRGYREGITLSYRMFRRTGGRWWPALAAAGGRAIGSWFLARGIARRAWHRGRVRGVFDHLAALRRDPALAEWTQRQDYLADHG